MRQVLENGFPIICDACREQWRPLTGFGAAYEVSDRGRVRRAAGGRGARAGQVIASKPNSGGYLQVQLFRDGARKWAKVHVLVATTFLGPRPDGLTINHIDGDKTNNAASNLEYLSGAENSRHAWRTSRAGRSFFGEQMGVPEAVERFAAEGVHVNLVWSRLAKGWSPERAVSTPAKPTGRPHADQR